jgi:hypothetical protein
VHTRRGQGDGKFIRGNGDERLLAVGDGQKHKVDDAIAEGAGHHHVAEWAHIVMGPHGSSRRALSFGRVRVRRVWISMSVAEAPCPADAV